MNIKEHIEAGHYERCEQSGGWNVVLRNKTTAKVFTTRCGGPRPIVGVVSFIERGWTAITWHADGSPERGTSNWSASYDLLPPPPRKAKVRARIECRPEGFCIRHLAKVDGGGFQHGDMIELSGEYEEPWEACR